MSSRTRTQITIQTLRTTVVHGLTVRCQQCGAEVSMITPERAEALHTTPQEIDELIDPGALQPVQETSSAKLICGNSLTPNSDSDAELTTELQTSEPPVIAGGQTNKGEEQ